MEMKLRPVRNCFWGTDIMKEIQKRKSFKINLATLRRWHSKGKSDRWIAIKLGVSQTGVSRARQKLGLVPNFLCYANEDLEKPPNEIYEDYIYRGREYKIDNKETLKKKNKIFVSTKEYRKRHRDNEKVRRAKIGEIRRKALVKDGNFVQVNAYPRKEIIDGDVEYVRVPSHLRKAPQRVENDLQRVEFEK